MTRKNQGQSFRNQQPSRGTRVGQQFDENQSWRAGYTNPEQNYEGIQFGPRPRNFSGNSSWSADDSAMDNIRPSSQSYRDTDYDLDGSTYGEFEANDLSRRPSKERETRSNSDRNMDRSGSSSERFGYPSNMNAWSGTDRSYNSGRTAGRMGQSSFGTHDYDSSNPHSYGAAGSSAFGSFGEGALDRSESSYWGGSESQGTNFQGIGPKGYKRSDDRIKEDVCETLARDHRIDASDIEVSVDDAMVTLSGTVESRTIKRAAEMVIENLSGVLDVKNDLKIKKIGEQGNEMQASGASRLNSGSTKSSSTKGTSQI
jgi:hypothetical protein